MQNPTEYFIHHTQQLVALLNKLDESQAHILQTRLHDNMFDFAMQVRISFGFALRALCPLAEQAIPDLAAKENSIAALIEQGEKTLAYILTLEEAKFHGWQTKKIHSKAGFADLTLSGQEHVFALCLPNMLFHFTQIYILAKQYGVKVSKGDFDGLHDYPSDFEFDANR